MKDTLVIALWAVVVGIWIVLILFTQDTREEHKCLSLQIQEQQYPNFFSTDYEKEMCAKHDIYLTK